MKEIMLMLGKSVVMALFCLFVGAVSVYASEVTPGTVVVEKEKNLKGIGKVGVAQYNISFAVEDGKMAVAESNKSKGLFGAKATASAYARIVGLQPETMQAIVDQAYADFLVQLKAAGLSVDASGYEKIKDHQYVKLHEGPVKDYSYYRAFNGKLHDITVAPSDMNVVKKNQSAIGLAADESELTLLSVEYLLHFGYFDSATQVSEATAISGAKAEARVTLGQGLQVYWHSGIDVINGHQNAFKKPNAKILVNKNFYSTTPYGNTTKDSASGGRKGLMGALTAGFVGGERYVINVVEDEYTEVALKVLKEVNEALVKALASKR